MPIDFKSWQLPTLRCLLPFGSTGARACFLGGARALLRLPVAAACCHPPCLTGLLPSSRRQQSVLFVTRSASSRRRRAIQHTQRPPPRSCSALAIGGEACRLGRLPPESLQCVLHRPPVPFSLQVRAVGSQLWAAACKCSTYKVSLLDGNNVMTAVINSTFIVSKHRRRKRKRERPRGF